MLKPPMEVSLAVLGQRLRALTARRVGLAAYLWGEAGIGKSHTSRALLRGTPYRSLTLPARLPLPELVRMLPRPARLRAWTRSALDNLEMGQTVTVPTADILAALLGQLAPFVLCLEDLHEADAARIQLVAQLADAVARTHGTALLVSSRLPPQDWPEGALVLALERLSTQASAALLTAEAGAELPAGALAWIEQRARGNPLFTLEYFRLLARQGHLWNSGDRWRWRTPQGDSLPVTVEVLIERELDRTVVSPASEALVAALALLPETMSDAQLAAVLERDAGSLETARADLHRWGVLSMNRFAHPLYREVAFRRLPSWQRQRLARRVIELFRNDPQALAVLSASLIDAAQLEPSEAVAALLQAAAGVSGSDCARLQARAAEYASGSPRPELAPELALQAAQGLRFDDLPEALRLAQFAVGLSPQHSAGLVLCAELLAAQGRLAEAEASLNRLPAAERVGGVWWARLIRLRGKARDHRGVLELWQAHPELHAHPEPSVSYAVAFASSMCDQLEQATALASHTLTRSDLDAATRCDLINVLGVVRYFHGDFAEAAEYQGQAITLARAEGLRHLEALYLSNRAMSLGELGQSVERVADLEDSLRLHLACGQLLQATRTQVTLADAHLDGARYAQAEDLLLEARDVLSRLAPSEHLVECEYRLSVLYRHWAPPHGGLLSVKHARAALRDARQLGIPSKLAWSLGYASIAESCFADAGAGQQLAQEALELATRLPAPGPRGMAQFAGAFALEALGRVPEALRAFEDTEAELLAHNVMDAAQEVGLEADRLAGRADSAASRLAWFLQQGQFNLAAVTCRYFPGLADAGPSPQPLPREVTSRPAPPTADEAPSLAVLGELRFVAAGTPVAVRGRKRRELLAHLLESRLRGRPDVPRLTLVDALYPGTEEARAASALKELVHQTRTALGAGIIQTTEGGYALGEVASDAELFLQCGDTSLWRGPYLAGEETQPGSLISDMLYGALLTRAGTLCAENPAETARVGRFLCEASPYDRAALALMLRALRAVGNHRSLGRFYASAQQEFEEVGETLPRDWATFLETQSAGERPALKPGSGRPD